MTTFLHETHGALHIIALKFRNWGNGFNLSSLVQFNGFLQKSREIRVSDELLACCHVIHLPRCNPWALGSDLSKIDTNIRPVPLEQIKCYSSLAVHIAFADFDHESKLCCAFPAGVE